MRLVPFGLRAVVTVAAGTFAAHPYWVGTVSCQSWTLSFEPSTRVTGRYLPLRTHIMKRSCAFRDLLVSSTECSPGVSDESRTTSYRLLPTRPTAVPIATILPAPIHSGAVSVEAVEDFVAGAALAATAVLRARQASPNPASQALVILV